MMRSLLLAATGLFCFLPLSVHAYSSADNSSEISKPDSTVVEKSLQEEATEMVALVMHAMPAGDAESRYETLTDEDFAIVAKELGVEVAAIKAVVRIEAGPKLQGFWAPGVPVINYAQSLFNQYKAKAKGRKIKDAKVPSGLSGYALKEWTSLTNARKINADAADMGTYWGMFQIGGFNYKLCGCQSVEEMVKKVCDSEFSQLEMFAVFIKNAGMLEALKKKDWTTFARKYNGSSYAKRGYHTRMAKEYANFKSQETKGKSTKAAAVNSAEKKDSTTKGTATKAATTKAATKQQDQKNSRSSTK